VNFSRLDIKLNAVEGDKVAKPMPDIL